MGDKRGGGVQECKGSLLEAGTRPDAKNATFGKSAFFFCPQLP